MAVFKFKARFLCEILSFRDGVEGWKLRVEYIRVVRLMNTDSTTRKLDSFDIHVQMISVHDYLILSLLLPPATFFSFFFKLGIHFLGSIYCT